MTFFGRVIEQIESVTDIFIPFLANVKEDYHYHILLSEGGTFKRWRCKSCKNIFIVSDCGEISNHRARNRMNNVGGMKCIYCQRPIGFGAEDNSEPVDIKLCQKKNFSTDAESEPSYINLNPGEIFDLNIRKLNKRTLVIGNIITHCLLLVSFVLADKSAQKSFIRTYFKYKIGSMDDDYKVNRNKILKDFAEHVEEGWNYLRNAYKFDNKKI